MVIKVKPKHLVWAAIGAVLILVARYVIFPPHHLPSEFSDARLKGAAVAQRIVELSRDTLSRLNDVAIYDQERNTSEALIAVSNAIIANRENQVEAIRLSSQLSAMAENLPKIKPARAKELATQAVTAEVALVSRLLYYNDYLNQLFEALRAKFEKPGIAYLDGKVNDLINKINDEVKAINELNKQFNSSMAEFDKIFAR
jgi:hypothetical protein